MNKELYKNKPIGYYGSVRREIVEEVPIGTHSVLEIGCGEGGTGAALKAEGRAIRVVGIELFEGAAQKAGQALDQVIVGNIEEIELAFFEAQFDVIILGDVLEHLIDPWTQLRRLSAFLSPKGIVVASLPNVRNWRVICALLLFGKWEYQNSGITDRTHLRFFTRREIIELFENNGLAIDKISPIGLGRLSEMIAKLPILLLRELVAPQYLVCARKRDNGHT